MALTIEVTKVSVTETMPTMWSIIFNLKCMESAVEVINKDFPLIYRYQDGVAPTVSIIRLLKEMQEEINRYNREQTLLAHSKVDTAVVYLQANLDGGV